MTAGALVLALAGGLVAGPPRACGRWRTWSARPTPSPPAISTSASPAPTSTTEVGRLARALNVMLERIEAAFAARLASEARLKESDGTCASSWPTPRTSCARRSPPCRPTPSCSSAARRPTPRTCPGSSRGSAPRRGAWSDWSATCSTLARLDEGRAPASATGRAGGLGAEAVHTATAVGPALAGDVHGRAPGRGAGRPGPAAPGRRQPAGQRAGPHPGGHHGHGARRSGRRPRPGSRSTTTAPACRPRRRPGSSSASTGPTRPGAGTTAAAASGSPSSRPSSRPRRHRLGRVGPRPRHDRDRLPPRRRRSSGRRGSSRGTAEADGERCRRRGSRRRES